MRMSSCCPQVAEAFIAAEARCLIMSLSGYSSVALWLGTTDCWAYYHTCDQKGCTKDLVGREVRIYGEGNCTVG
jgi:hypothetical protein